MKGFNVFLAVLIFLLAATSAVFSFFLFEKRAQLVTGYGYMAGKVEDAIKLMDANSGTKLADKVNQGTMAHDKSNDLPKLLPEFVSLTTEVAKERDTLASTLAQVSTTLENRASADKFAKLNSYKAATQQLQSYVNNYQSRNNAILSKVQNSARQLGANVTVSALKSSGYANAYSAFDKRIAFWKKRDGVYSQRVRNIAAALGASTPNLSESGYETALSNVVTAARKVRNDKDTFYKNWQNAERNIKNLNAVISKKNSQISSLNNTIKSKDAEIARLNRVMGVEPPRSPLQDGCEAALNMVKSQQKGRILEVDDKFGFVVVSLGRNTRVQEAFGNKVNNVDPQIPQGTILTVARNMPSGEAEYINKVKIVRLDDNCSIAEPIDKQAGKRMREGDMVYLADDEIAKLLKNRK
jgi:uncharacterized coiled-coil DUF342 family protein